MQAIGQQGHRTEGKARADLYDRHRACQRDDDQGTRLTRSLDMLTKRVRVLPERGLVLMHVEVIVSVCSSVGKPLPGKEVVHERGHA